VTRVQGDDTAPLEVTGMETDMHKHLLKNPTEITDGLRAIEHERDPPYATVDVYGTDAEGRPVAIEDTV